jgi:hypothetical protein
MTGFMLTLMMYAIGFWPLSSVKVGSTPARRHASGRLRAIDQLAVLDDDGLLESIGLDVGRELIKLVALSATT